LAAGEPDERIAAVKKVLEEQEREGGKRPDAKDMAKIHAWIDDCATRHQADFLKSLPTDAARKLFLEAGKQLQQRSLNGYLRWQWRPIPNSAKLPPLMTADDLTRLRDKLSPETQKRLEGKTPVEQWQLVAAWMRQGFRRAFEGRLRGPLPQGSDDRRLAEFFEHLSAEDRDRLLSLPGDEIQGALQQMFFNNRNGSPEGPGWRNRGPGGPERPAPNRSGPPPQQPPPGDG
jgi:hypothetical protein